MSKSSKAVRSRCEAALAEALRKARPETRWHSGYPNYLARPEDNLAPGLKIDLVAEDFGQGAGSELLPKNGMPPKFSAAYSSSALAVNSFGIFKERPHLLTVAGLSGFRPVRFEVRCPTGLRGTPPHLDVLCEGDSHVLALESKCTEYIGKKAARFSGSYKRVPDDLFEEPWRRVYEMLRDDPLALSPLDAAQLVKHYLGLRNVYRDKRATLAYLFWEPRNPEQEVFRRHAAAIQRFAGMVDGSEVRFVAMSYRGLWEQWSEAVSPQCLRDHVRFLRARYDVAV